MVGIRSRFEDGLVVESLFETPGCLVWSGYALLLGRMGLLGMLRLGWMECMCIQSHSLLLNKLANLYLLLSSVSFDLSLPSPLALFISQLRYMQLMKLGIKYYENGDDRTPISLLPTCTCPAVNSDNASYHKNTNTEDILCQRETALDIIASYRAPQSWDQTA